MNTLFKIAWRNVWRSRLRTFVILGAIILGVWAVIFITSLSNGMVKSYINNAVQTEVSHIQIHHPDFLKDRAIEFSVGDADKVLASIQSTKGVKAVTKRTLTNAMLSSSKGARGVQVKAIDFNREKEVTNIATKVIEGEFFEEKGRNPILISRRIADKLKVKVRSKMVLTFTDLSGEVTAASFRVKGIFNTGIAPFDEANVIIRQEDLNRLLAPEAVLINQAPDQKFDVESLTHEFALLVNDTKLVDEIAGDIEFQFPHLKVQTFRQVSPELELYETSIGLTGMIVMTIFMLALIFGIINTMLMAVLERIKELGMLMAVGMNKRSVFSMVVIETLMLGLIGTPIGLFLGYLTVTYFGNAGIDLSSYGEGIEGFGMSTMLYPSLENSLYIQLAIGVFITAILGSLYPAWKAIRLKPVEAIRSL